MRAESSAEVFRARERERSCVVADDGALGDTRDELGFGDGDGKPS